MKPAWLAWYSSGVLFLLSLLTSLVTWHPEKEHLGLLFFLGFLAGSVLLGGVAVWLQRLPSGHPLSRSIGVLTALFVVACIVTAMLVLSA